VLLVATGGWTWVIGMILVGSSVGYWRAGRSATAVILSLSVAVGIYAVVGHAGTGGTVGLVFETLVPGLMAQVGAKRHEAVLALIKARRELATSAVTAERLRIARDLHDLLGHSLSVIALKAELAERLVHTDADRARAELSDVQTVARRSLEEVRQAVEGYRRADLDTELSDAREVLMSAGVACAVDRGDTGSFPAAVDAMLGWAVREATTNILRHSRAQHATFRLVADHDEATVEVLDDGTGCPNGSGGNGLDGLAERAARLGGRVEHGARATGGFRLAVTVPVGDR
jgi:two-component system sensor histidine kinase DesK